ncbi:MAG: hypothetical protein R3D89_12145 [Sphingomonadaceae bacterium]
MPLLRIFDSTGSVDFRGETLISLEELRFLGGSADYTVQFNAAQFGFDAISADAHPGVTRTIEIFMDTQSFANFSGVTVTGFVSTDTLLIHGDGGRRDDLRHAGR